MEYNKVRDTLKDGQVVFILAKTWKQKLICLVTGGRFSHVGFLVWMYDGLGRKRLMCIESNFGGARLVQASAYIPRGMTVLDIGIDWTEYEDSAFGDTGKLPYSIPNLVLIGMKTLLNKVGLRKLAKLVPRDHHGEVCSEYVATLLVEVGRYQLDAFISPHELYEMLMSAPVLRGVTVIEAVD
jgi:hypothetical protein